MPEDKFEACLSKKATNRKVLKDYKKYDLIVVIHASCLMGLEDFPDEFWDKVVLLPMFLTSSYIKSGERVPEIFFEEEKRVIAKIKKVITPSITEKEELISVYGMDDSNVVVIPRGVSHIFEYCPSTTLNKNINICMVGGIKKQKNCCNIRK